MNPTPSLPLYHVSLWILIIANPCNFQDSPVRDITRCAWTNFGVLLCPLDRVADITSIYAGVTADAINCHLNTTHCGAEITYDTFAVERRRVMERCNGLSACKRFYPPTVRIPCANRTQETNYITITYGCIEHVRVGDPALQWYGLCTDDYFHKPLCHLGEHISVRNVYFGRNQQANPDDCAVRSSDCVYATDREDFVKHLKAECNGKAACTGSRAFYDNFHCGKSHYMVVQYNCVDARFGHLQTANVPFERYYESSLCPFGQTIHILEAYAIANRSHRETNGLVPDDWLVPLDQDIARQCDGHVVCENLRVSSTRLRCPVRLVSADHALLLYACDKQQEEVFSSIACVGDKSQSLHCPDNAISVSVAYIGYTEDDSCSGNPSYEVGHCLRSFQATWGPQRFNDLQKLCRAKEVCEISPPNVKYRQCNGISRDQNDYLIVAFTCEEKIHVKRACIGESINMSCSVGNTIHIESVSYIELRLVVSEISCKSALNAYNTEESCRIFLNADNTYFAGILDHCQNARVCGPLHTLDLSASCVPSSVTGLGQIEIQYSCKSTVDPDTETSATPTSMTSPTQTRETVNDTSNSLYIYLVVGVVGVILACAPVIVVLRKRRRTPGHVMPNLTIDISSDNETRILCDENSTIPKSAAISIRPETVLYENTTQKTNKYENLPTSKAHIYENDTSEPRTAHNSSNNMPETQDIYSSIEVLTATTNEADSDSGECRRVASPDIAQYTAVKKTNINSEEEETLLVDNAFYSTHL